MKYLNEDADKLIDACGKIPDADVTKAVNSVGNGVPKECRGKRCDDPGNEVVLFEINEVGADRKEDQC